MKPLISVHVAKAGGTSARELLRSAYGDKFADDYADDPADPLSARVIDPERYMARRQPLPPGALCVHGHFHPGKYEAPEDGVMFTMLRHPVDNVLSIYWFWKALPRGPGPLHRYFLDNDLTITETARLPILRHLYSVTYFGGFDMGRFNVIGQHENRESALRRLSELIDVPLDVHVRENVTQPSEERAAMSADPAVKRELENTLADDIRFYERYTS